jgi:isocitrate/isopropylmalate dehydrogenase
LCFDALKDASTLKPEIVSGLDILIVRELMGGVYFGLPKETTTLPDGQKRAVDTGVYTTSEIERVCRVAFDMARLRGNKVHSAEKSNVMVTGVGAQSQAVRRSGDRQSVRRCAVGRSRPVDRLHRHAAQRLAGRQEGERPAIGAL